MKKYVCDILIVFSLLLITSCNKNISSELVGAHSSRKWNEPTPLGMNFVHQGFFRIGPDAQDPAWGPTTTKTVSIDAFWMDDTEITNNEYRQFVNWVRDSIARTILAAQYPEFMLIEDRRGNPINPPIINWKEKIDWKDQEYQQAMDVLYLPASERFFHQRKIDSRKLYYTYYWIDLKQAAKGSNKYNYDAMSYNGAFIDKNGEEHPIENRSSFILKERVPIYPDTLCWIRDFTYSYNDPRARNYFWHPAFGDYPVVGVTWKQATAFCHWRSKYRNDFLSSHGLTIVDDYRLPTEGEWEYAARGGRQNSMFPWGGYYTRKHNGVFFANFKPARGNYLEDGGMATKEVRSYDPNDFGLYDMSGNVAEWTSNAYDESAYEIIHDFNPNYEYNAKPDDPPVMKRKVVRGGSWKDVEAYQQVSTRSYEYQDTAKCYIGFRCVRSSFCDQ